MILLGSPSFKVLNISDTPRHLQKKGNIQASSTQNVNSFSRHSVTTRSFPLSVASFCICVLAIAEIIQQKGNEINMYMCLAVHTSYAWWELSPSSSLEWLEARSIPSAFCVPDPSLSEYSPLLSFFFESWEKENCNLKQLTCIWRGLVQSSVRKPHIKN